MRVSQNGIARVLRVVVSAFLLVSAIAKAAGGYADRFMVSRETFHLAIWLEAFTAVMLWSIWRR